MTVDITGDWASLMLPKPRAKFGVPAQIVLGHMMSPLALRPAGQRITIDGRALVAGLRVADLGLQHCGIRGRVTLAANQDGLALWINTPYCASHMVLDCTVDSLLGDTAQFSCTKSNLHTLKALIQRFAQGRSSICLHLHEDQLVIENRDTRAWLYSDLPASERRTQQVRIVHDVREKISLAFGAEPFGHRPELRRLVRAMLRTEKKGNEVPNMRWSLRPDRLEVLVRTSVLRVPLIAECSVLTWGPPQDVVELGIDPQTSLALLARINTTREPFSLFYRPGRIRLVWMESGHEVIAAANEVVNRAVST